MFKTPLALLLCSTAALAQNTVALDNFHNNESKMPDHYTWDGARNGGFSELAKVLKNMKAELRTVKERVTDASLKGVKVFIIVDPDTLAETADPQYIETSEADAIESWVRGGGRLVLLGNDKGNAEFEHMNQLAERFGIQFLEETYPKVQGKGILIAKGAGTYFEGAPEVYMVEVAPLKLSGDAKPVLTDNGAVIMAEVAVGHGRVFAVGDPWIYNEYIDKKDNRAIATKLFQNLLR